MEAGIQSEHGLTEVAAAFVAKASYSEIPALLRETIQKSTVDLIGVSLAATVMAQGANEVVDFASEWSGGSQASFVQGRGKGNVMAVTFENSCFGHALDFDDTLDDAGMHPTVLTLPVALAVAEYLGGVSGPELLTAVAIGGELACRLGRSVLTTGMDGQDGEKPRWMQNTIFGPVAAAATAGKLLGLDESQLAHAFGIALHRAGGTQALGYATGSIIRSFYAGFCNTAGLASAMMASKGITGTPNALEIEYGLFDCFYPLSESGSALQSLGTEWQYAEVSLKPWPACRAAHPYITGILDVLRDNQIDWRDVERVLIRTGPLGVSLCTPIEQRRRPKTSMDGRFSIPFSVAVAAVNDNVSLEHFSTEALRDPGVCGFADRITATLDDEVSARGQFAVPGIIEVWTAGGDHIVKDTGPVLGHPSRPMTLEEVRGKFNKCANFASSSSRNEARLRSLNQLFEAPNTGELIAQIMIDG